MHNTIEITHLSRVEKLMVTSAAPDDQPPSFPERQENLQQKKDADREPALLVVRNKSV